MAGYKNNHVLISIPTPPVLQHPSPSSPIIWWGRSFNSFFTLSLDPTDIKQALWAELSANGLVNGVALDCLGLEPHLWSFLEAEGPWVILGCLGSAWVLDPWKGIADQNRKAKVKTPYCVCLSPRNPFSKEKWYVRKTEKKHQINATFGRKDFAFFLR